MIHTFQTMLTGLVGSLLAHMDQWDGWAVLVATAVYGYRRAPLWLPLVVALIINPMPYGFIAGVAHGHLININAAALFTLDQIIVAYAGYLLGRLITRFR